MSTWQVIHADCRDALRALPERSVHCVVTSPPFYGLRDYGVDGQIGIEPTPDEYVAALVDVFRDVRRVLRDDGTVWLNLGDSYNADGRKGRAHMGEGKNNGYSAWVNKTMDGTKPKDLLGIPWMVAFALRADGWVLRSDIVWSKANPMPESVTDRPTKSHEMVFLLSKAKRIGREPTKYDDIPEGEARWLAALMDAEGSIVLRRESPGADGSYGAHAAQLSIGGTCRALLDRIAAVVGEGSVLERAGINAPMFYWQTSGKRAAGLLRRLYPFLVVKQRQARCVIHLESGKAYRGGKPITTSEVAVRERLWEAVKSLNHFGEPDLSWVPEPEIGRWVSQPYFYDADAIREDAEPSGWAKQRAAGVDTWEYGKAAGGTGVDNTNGIGGTFGPGGRNKRSVWTVATQPYAGAHFATFPPKLIEPCILAGAPERACGECGAPWTRVVERGDLVPVRGNRLEGEITDEHKLDGSAGSIYGAKDRMVRTDEGWSLLTRERISRGFTPSCECHDACGCGAPCERGDTWGCACHVTATGVVLDPFVGAGTTGLVALQHGRSFIGIELSAEYARMARERIDGWVRCGFRAPARGPDADPAQATFDLFGEVA